MNLNQLECFIVVAQYLNFTEAAKTLHVVQSAVSRNIAELEKELNTKLFIRNKRSVSLTDVGRILLEDAYKITALVKDATIRTQRWVSGETGYLKLGYVFTPTLRPVMHLIKRFCLRYPEVDLGFRTCEYVTIDKRLEQKDVDVAFVQKITVQHMPELQWRPLYQESFKLVVSKEHPLAKRTRIELKTLVEEKFIFMNRKTNSGMFDTVLNLCLNEGFFPNVMDDSNDIDTALMIVGLGIGITLLPECWRNYISGPVNFVDIDSDKNIREIGIAWNIHNQNPAIGLFLSELGINVAENPSN
jgi:DNA-binding transcriptional LysR family regulator